MASLIEELRRRNVFRVSIAYLAVAWLLLQVADIVLPVFGVASWALRAMIIVFAFGLPVAIGIAWAYELTPDGVKRAEEAPTPGRFAKRTNRRLDFVIIAVLSLALITVIVDQYILEGPAFPEVSRLAVLPLANLSGDPDQDYFADGMTDALITSLAKVRAWRVVSRTSIMRFKGTDRSLPAIAAELDVDAIIEGSVIRDGGRIRITAQLVDVKTDQHLWAESYDRDFQDVFILQSEIAKAIAREVQIAVTPAESARLARAAELSTDGYDAYLKGLQHFYRLTPHELEIALQYFDISLEQNPDSALAHTGVAATWIGLQQMGFLPSSQATPKAEAAALRALEIDPDLAEAHHWLAVVRSWSDWKWAVAEELFKRAIELNPSYADARTSYSHLLAILGRFDEALVQAELAIELDPLNGWFQGIYGVDLHMIRRYDEAIETFQEAIRLSPDLPFVWFVLTGSYHFAGRFEDAIKAEGALWAALGDAEKQQAILQKYAEHGYQEAINWSADMAAERSLAIGANGVWVAYRYSRAGQDEKVIEWMERGYEQRDPTMPYMLMPELDNVRSDPRIQVLMRQMDLL